MNSSDTPSDTRAARATAAALRPLPDLDVEAPDGRRVRLSNIGPSTRIGEVADALRVGEGRFRVDGVDVDPDRAVGDVDLQTGSRLSAGDEPDASPSRVSVRVVAGSDCGPPIALPAGRHVIGRSRSAAVRIDDPSVELHHAILDVGEDGDASVIQLCGRVPIRTTGGEPLAADEPGALIGPVRFDLGAARVEVEPVVVDPVGRDPGPDRPGTSIVSHRDDPWRRVVRRAPTSEPEPPLSGVRPPRPPDDPVRPSAITLVGAGTAAAGALVMALVLSNAMFAVFAGLGAFTALATWSAGSFTAGRERRRSARAFDASWERFVDELTAAADARRAWYEVRHRGVADAVDVAHRRSAELWMRRGWPLRATVGIGVPQWSSGTGNDEPCEDAGVTTWSTGSSGSDLSAAVDAARLDAERGDDLAVPVTVGVGDVIGITGPCGVGDSVVRSIVVQLATWYGPADWRLLVVSARPAAWSWVAWLPHRAVDSVVVAPGGDGEGDGGGRSGDLAGALQSCEHRRSGVPVILVVDDPRVLTDRTGALRRFVERTESAVLVSAEQHDTLPAVCTRVLRVGATGRATWHGEVPDTDTADGILASGITGATARAAARRLAALTDPECAGTVAATVPERARFGDLLDGSPVVTPDATALWSDWLRERWRHAGHDPAPIVSVGRGASGVVDIDLARDGPHGLLAGTTGSGKSELLRSIVLGLAMSTPPTHLQFVLVDYKGGAAFDACAALPHTVGVVTDLDAGLAERAIVSLDAELRRRERLLRDAGVSDLAAHRLTTSEEAIARLVVVVDEFAALASEHPDLMDSLVGVAQRGRSLGVHLLLATQRPAGVIGDDIRANTNLRMSLRLNDRADAIDVLGDALPTRFARDVPGRLAIRVGGDDPIVVQSAWCTGPVEASPLPEVSGIVLRSLDDGPDGHDVASSPARPDDGAPVGGTITELQLLVRAIGDAAEAAGSRPGHRPWIDPLPHPLREVDGPGDDRSVGLVDDPARQRRHPLRWRPEDGNLALIGSVGAGTTSTLITLAAATCRRRRAEDVHLYVIDARGDDRLVALGGLAHCGGVVPLADVERTRRVLSRVADDVERRLAGGGAARSPTVVLMVDGWSSTRTALRAPERTDDAERLDRIACDGPGVGVVVVAADDATPAVSTFPATDRWVMGLTDPAARTSGLVSSPVGMGRPGRLRMASSGLEAQVILGAPGLAGLPGRHADRSGPVPISSLPSTVAFDPNDTRWCPTSTRTTTRLIVGLGASDLEPDGPSIARPDPLLVVGAARSGVSTALLAIERSWRLLHGAAAIVVRLDRGDPATLARRLAVRPVDAPTLVIVDDAHRVDHADGIVGELVTGRHPSVLLVAGARTDVVRSAYGHWTRDVARARCGIVLAGRSDEPGIDLFGVALPRRPLVAPRVGLAWLVDDGPVRQVQIARDAPEPGPHTE